jgi:hypothetical protein
MLKFQYVPHEVISAEDFRGTAAGNVFVTPDGDVAILDGNHAVLIMPDADNPMVAIRHGEILRDSLIDSMIDFAKKGDLKCLDEVKQVYRALF